MAGRYPTREPSRGGVPNPTNFGPEFQDAPYSPTNPSGLTNPALPDPLPRQSDYAGANLPRSPVDRRNSLTPEGELYLTANKDESLKKYLEDRAKNLANTKYANYDMQYFSGSQAQVFFGDVWVDDVVQISYGIASNKRPIYGYASKYYDCVTAGNVLVSGSFAINFKETGYIPIILNNLMKQKTPSFGGKGFVPLFGSEKVTTLDQPWTGYTRSLVAGELDPAFIHPTAGTVNSNRELDLAKQLYEAPVSEFDYLAAKFSESLWSSTGNSARSDHKKFFDMDGFDIFIVFGDYNNPLAHHTVKKIVDVHLIGSSQTVSIDGNVVGEAYDFFARDCE